MSKIGGSGSETGSGSIIQKYGSTDQDLYKKKCHGSATLVEELTTSTVLEFDKRTAHRSQHSMTKVKFPAPTSMFLVLASS
jgi:hypothetical protein